MKKPLRIIVFMAMLVAMTIVLVRFLKIDILPGVRISFENLPVIVGSLMLGPVCGAIVGGAADALGSFMFPTGSPIPILSVCCAIMGVLPYMLKKYIFKKKSFSAMLCTVMISHILVSMIAKTLVLASVFGSVSTSFWGLFVYRAPIYLCIGVVEAYVAYILEKRKAVKYDL